MDWIRTSVNEGLASKSEWLPWWITFVQPLGPLAQTIMAEYDARTDEALSRLASTLPHCHRS